MKHQHLVFVLITSFLIFDTVIEMSLPTPVGAAIQSATQSRTGQTDKSGPEDKGVISIGSTLVSQQASPTTVCLSNAKTNFVEGRMGTVTAIDGSQWTVPSNVNDGPVAVDLYNDCTGMGDNSKKYLAQLKTVTIDPDGKEVTAFIFANNYFELYINGTLVGRDSITFVPFNSSVVRFKVNYPYTIAFKLVDWETHLGIGSEYDNYQIGHSCQIADVMQPVDRGQSQPASCG